MPALDGLRALAVLAVVLYHGDVSGLPGGFLGVEVFFVISGYLITALLIAERRSTGRTAYLQFWMRRARRLLPALFALIAVVATYWVILHPDEVARLRGDIVGALTYVTNWYQIVVEQSYFETMGRPSPLRHMWSLAVEEQFYLIWPLALAGIWRITRGRRVLMVRITLALAAASAIYAMILFQPGSDPSRVYYGTDTRAAGVLLGAALALAVPPWLMRARVTAQARRAVTLIGTVGLAGIAVMIATVTEFDSFTYRGGFVLLDLFTLATILALIHPCRTVWARIFALEPLLWIGRRSYGIYLWHWPIFVLTREQIDVPLQGWSLLALRLALTFAIAEVSYRFVEMPVRNGALSRWWARRNEPGGLIPPRARRPAMVGAVAAMVVAMLVVVASPPRAEIAGVDLSGVVTDSVGNVIDDGPSATSQTTASSSTTTSTTVLASTTSSTVVGSTTSTLAMSAAAVPSAVSAGSDVIAIGDSVLLGARTAVRTALPGITMNAEVGRQFSTLGWLIPTLAQTGGLRSTVIIHLGTNGPPTDAQLKKALDALIGVPRVVLVTTHADRSWEEVTNQRIRNAAMGRSNVVLADWYAIAAGHPEWFVQDGIHLSVDGANAYANLLASSI
jgi:peptidoglycan/LPS O-acetylase OafA/YrhL